MRLSLVFFILISSLLCTLPATITAQTTSSLGYGLKLGANYATIGSDYRGLANFSAGGFINKPIANNAVFFVEPGFTVLGIKEKQSDIKHMSYYLDAHLFSYLYPDSRTRDFAFILGVRPSYLLAYNSQVFNLGNYQTRQLPYNNNSKGQLDVVGSVGLTIAFSPILNLDLTYNQSFTNQNTATNVQGRPSAVEVALRFNAVSLKKTLDNQALTLQQEIDQFQKGCLLVMLGTPNQKQLDRLKAQGNEEEYNLILYELKIRNTRVYNEFERTYSFNKVYFFYDTSVTKLIAGQTEGIFVNKSLEVDSSINVPPQNYLIASFCEDFSNYTGRRHFGLFMYDKNMIQLPKPYNHPNQLASPVFEYVVVRGEESKMRRPSYITVPYDRLINKFNSRMVRYWNN